MCCQTLFLQYLQVRVTVNAFTLKGREGVVNLVQFVDMLQVVAC